MLPTIFVTAPRMRDDLQKVASEISFPDEYSLDDITLITPVGNVNVKALVSEISIFEDIFRVSITGHILVQDSMSLIDKLKMSGNEFLKLSFRKSKLSDDSYEKTFRIIRVGERNRINHNTETYTLHFCSEDFMVSEQIKISKSYKGKTIKEMVNDILVNELKSNASKLIGDTVGTYDFIIPYKKPFEAISWLSNYAISPKYKGADFVFFENNSGFFFTSLQQLYSKKVARYYRYSPKGASSMTNIPEMESRLYNIKSYTFIDTFDTLYGTNNGVFANRTLTIDPLTRTYRDTTFSYTGNDTSHLNGGSLINNYTNRLGLKANECYNATYKLAFSNADQKKAPGIKDKEYAVSNDIRAEQFIPYRTSQLANSNYNRLQLTISGDPKITVGDLIYVDLPSNNNEKGTVEDDGSNDKLHSGKYLITALRHIIDINMRYETIIEVAKDSFSLNPGNYGEALMKRIGKES